MKTLPDFPDRLQKDQTSIETSLRVNEAELNPPIIMDSIFVKSNYLLSFAGDKEGGVIVKIQVIRATSSEG